MTTIDGIGWPAASRSTRRSRAAAGFALPAEMAPAADASPTADPSAPDPSTPAFAAFMEGLLGLQEQGPEASSVPAARDREARRHGQDLLSTLAEMQLALVGPGSSPASSARLSERLSVLADGVPVAADPRLRAILAAIALRARVELARRPS